MQIFALILFLVGVIGFFNATLSLTFVTWGIAFLLFIWDHHSDKQAAQDFKREYISKFDQTRLYSSLQNPNLVYERISQNEETLTLKTIWSGNSPIDGSETYEIKNQELRPFDLDLFISLT